MRALKSRQRGVSLTGLIMAALVLIFVAVVGMKLAPAYIHNARITEIFKAMAADPELQNASVKEIQNAFVRRTSVDSITELNASDIEIENDGGRLSLSANYSVKVPLVGNMTLVLEFNPSSS